VVGMAGNVIYLPLDTTHTLKLDTAGTQRYALAITAWGSDIVVRSTGTYVTVANNPITRSISMDFNAKAIPTRSFDFAVASKGQIVVSKAVIGVTGGADPSLASLMPDQAIPGTNPQFAGGAEVDGIMYVRSPNTLTFRGNFTLKGFIVFENAGSSAVNKMDFRGSITVSPLPADPQFDPMRSVSGIAILAPTA